jgi:hypothetical protein
MQGSHLITANDHHKYAHNPALCIIITISLFYHIDAIFFNYILKLTYFTVSQQLAGIILLMIKSTIILWSDTTAFCLWKSLS